MIYRVLYRWASFRFDSLRKFRFLYFSLSPRPRCALNLALLTNGITALGSELGILSIFGLSRCCWEKSEYVFYFLLDCQHMYAFIVYDTASACLKMICVCELFNCELSFPFRPQSTKCKQNIDFNAILLRTVEFYMTYVCVDVCIYMHALLVAGVYVMFIPCSNCFRVFWGLLWWRYLLIRESLTGVDIWFLWNIFPFANVKWQKENAWWSMYLGCILLVIYLN